MKSLRKLAWALGAAIVFMMAEVERAAQKPTAAGVVPAVIEGMNAADTQLIPNKNGTVTLRITNGAEENTVTIVTPNEAGGNPIEDKKVVLAAAAVKIIGPFDPGTYNNSKGQLEVKMTKVAGVKMEIQDTSF
jgi:hypothetical protein